MIETRIVIPLSDQGALLRAMQDQLLILRGCQSLLSRHRDPVLQSSLRRVELRTLYVILHYCRSTLTTSEVRQLLNRSRDLQRVLVLVPNPG